MTPSCHDLGACKDLGARGCGYIPRRVEDRRRELSAVTEDR